MFTSVFILLLLYVVVSSLFLSILLYRWNVLHCTNDKVELGLELSHKNPVLELIINKSFKNIYKYQ